MAFQLTSGGVVVGLGTALTHSPIAPHFMGRNPRTLLWKSPAVKTQNIQLGFKSKLSPSFLSGYQSHKRFSQYDPNIERLNPFKDLGYFKNRTVLLNSTDLTRKSIRTGRSFATSTATDHSVSISRDSAGQYRIEAPLSNDQKCLFTVNNSMTIKSFLAALQEEDPSIKGVSLSSSNGVKFAGSTPLAEVFSAPFQLTINNKRYNVNFAAENKISPNVAQPTTLAEYDQMKNEIIPLYIQKQKLDSKSEREANWVIYAGLGYLLAQGCFLARLTWWDFNWDIMEPVTYFVTFATALLSYFYFTVTRREYTFVDIRESAKNSRMFKNYIKHRFPIERYFTLEHKLKSLDPEAMEKIDWEVQEGFHSKEQPALTAGVAV